MTQQTQTFINILRELQKIDPEFPLQYAICLSYISLNEGLSMTDLVQRTGLALSTISRIVGALSTQRQMGKPYNLVEVRINENERRKKELYLTAQGRKVMANIATLLFQNEVIVSPAPSEKKVRRTT